MDIITTRSIWLPPTDGSEVLYIPFWHPTYGGNPATYISKDKNAISCARTGGTWGKYGLAFNGIANDVVVTHSSILNLGASGSSYSIGFWVNPDTTNNNEAVSVKTLDGSADAWWIAFRLTSNQIRFSPYDGTTQPTVNTNALNTGRWYLIFCVRDDDDLYIYQDGVLIESSLGTGLGDCSNTGNIQIGGRTGSGFLEGRIGEFWLYSRALSAGEVLRNYQRTRWRYVS